MFLYLQERLRLSIYTTISSELMFAGTVCVRGMLCPPPLPLVWQLIYS